MPEALHTKLFYMDSCIAIINHTTHLKTCDCDLDTAVLCVNLMCYVYNLHWLPLNHKINICWLKWSHAPFETRTYPVPSGLRNPTDNTTSCEAARPSREAATVTIAKEPAQVRVSLKWVDDDGSVRVIWNSRFLNQVLESLPHITCSS